MLMQKTFFTGVNSQWYQNRFATADDKDCIPKWCVCIVFAEHCRSRVFDETEGQIALNNDPPDIDYLQYIVTQERALISAMDNVSHTPAEQFVRRTE